MRKILLIRFIILQRVRKYLITDTAEKLVCDFSLHTGDSFHYYYHRPIGTKFLDKDVWIKVDSVFYLNGLKHIRFDTAHAPELALRKNEATQKEEGISVYPNPANDKLFFRIKRNSSENLNIKIYDYSGR